MAAQERIVVLETPDEREVVVREPAAQLVPVADFAGTGPGRGTWEDAHPVFAVYIPPRAA